MNILVTGGSSGLGKSVVELFATEKSNTVYFTYKSHKEEAEKISSVFSNAVAVHCDFINPDSLEKFVNKIPGFDLDVLINNAYSGITLGNHFHKTPVSEFNMAFQTNVLPLIAITQKAIDSFKKKKSGKIITVLTSALIGTPPMGYSVYSATKAYIAQLVKSWSKEYIKFGISSNAIAPDFMQTSLTSETNDLVVEQIKNSNPMKKLLTTVEVAKIIRDFTTVSNQLNGVIIPVNAGVNIL